MRHSLIVLIVGFCLGTPAWLQSVSGTSDQTVIDFVRNAVPRALDYDQGNRASLVDAQDNFTAEGWQEFMKWLSGYVDEEGAPTGSSHFTAAGEPKMESQENGIIRLTLRGTLKQYGKIPGGALSATTYRVIVDVELTGNPPKIRHLEVRACGSTPCEK